MRNPKDRGRIGKGSAVRALPEATAESVPAWELLESGRYMPRRIRGSFPGRELG